MTASGGEIEKNQYLRMKDDLNTAVRLVENYDNVTDRRFFVRILLNVYGKGSFRSHIFVLFSFLSRNLLCNSFLEKS